MKYILLLLLPLFGQSQLVAKSKTIANLSALGYGEVELKANPDSRIMYIEFSNRKYGTLVDYRYIDFHSVKEFSDFILTLKMVDKDHDYVGKNYNIVYTPKNQYSGPKLIVSTKNDEGWYYMPVSFIKKYEKALTSMQ